MQPKYFESLYPENSRDSEIEQLVSYIKEGNSSQLIGVSGSGRSNVLGLLSYNSGVRLRHFPLHHGIVHFVMVNFSEIKKRPYIEVVKFIFLSLDSSLRERGMQEEYEKVDGLFKEGLSYGDELVLTQRLKSAIEYLAVEKKLTIIFLFNQFEEYLPQVDDDLFILLRSLRDRAKYRFSVIFSVCRPIEDSLEPEIYGQFSDFLVGHAVYLKLYDQPSVLFRTEYLEKLTNKKLPEVMKKELLRLTGGHMRLIKNSTEAILASKINITSVISSANERSNKISHVVRNDKDIRIEDRLEAFLFTSSAVRSTLRSIYDSLAPAEQIELVGSSQGLVFSSSEEAYLQRVGLIANGEIKIPLFAKALQEKLFKEGSVQLIYDETTNTIKKGEAIISDMLTKAEFKLLRYLLLHPGEVLERETIIGSVWQEDKTIQGISEQALDQLIFRLRRKIEQDPNVPIHLQTIKGRGIKYNP